MEVKNTFSLLYNVLATASGTYSLNTINVDST